MSKSKRPPPATLTALFAVTVLGGCASYATRPIALSEATKREYVAWTRDNPTFFAVTRDGKVSGNTTCMYGASCNLSKVSEALSRCEMNAAAKGNITGCLIYAIDGKPVVDDPELTAFVANAPASALAPVVARASAVPLSTIQCVQVGKVIFTQDRVAEHSVTTSPTGQVTFTGKDSDGKAFLITAAPGDSCQVKPAA